jgi:thioredoxin reductase
MLEANGIGVRIGKIARLSGPNGRLTRILFTDGSSLSSDALFFDTPCRQQSDLAKQAGCRLTRDGRVRCDGYTATSIPGIFAAGNILKGVQLSIVAAGDGARAAFAINRELTREDFSCRAQGRRSASKARRSP